MLLLIDMKKFYLNLIPLLLVALLLPSSCDNDEYEDKYDSTIEHKDGKVVLKFIMPFVIDKIQSGELADRWQELRLISLDKSGLMEVRAKFLSENCDKTHVEMEFPNGIMEIKGKYVLCFTPQQVVTNRANAKASEDETSGTDRYVIEITQNAVTSVAKACSMSGFSYGDGTEDNPYQIFGADDFYMLIYNLYKR